MLTIPGQSTEENYSISEFQDLNTFACQICKYSGITRKKHGIEYYNIPAAFDIETTSFYDQGEKRATMYEWTFGIDEYIIVGRTWHEYLCLMDRVKSALELSGNKRLIVFVHNLSWEFQWIRGYHPWKKVFATDERKVLYANTEDGITFRCSYQLSGYNLATLARNLTAPGFSKMTGDLDYSKPRHTGTPLTMAEWRYCIFDVLIVLEYIREQIAAEHGNINNIPLTKTGRVRKYCRSQCYFNGGKHRKNKQYERYRSLMETLQITGPDEYYQLQRAFAGGFTHANAWYIQKNVRDVGSYDFMSSYPAQMVLGKFPMSAAEEIEIRNMDDLRYNLKHYCCLFDVVFWGIKEHSDKWDNPLSRSKCTVAENAVVNNGRIVSADRIVTTCTDIDFKIYADFYTVEKFKVFNFRRYSRGYLPTPLVLAILKLYNTKTTLRGVEGKEEEYVNGKENLNSCYGMAVTSVCKPLSKYDTATGEWTTEEVDVEKEIDKYNKSKNRFLFYPWGVWVTANARRALFTGIKEWGSDYVYSDTDSIKGRNIDLHKRYIDLYNRYIDELTVDAAKYHGIPVEMFRPKTKNGDEKPIGYWDFEGVYDVFRPLGAKRYMVMSRGKLSITVSGLNKNHAVPYMEKKWGRFGAFEHFDEYMFIPAEFTGKNTHTYIDSPMSGTLIDYRGVPGKYDELSGIHLEPAEYEMSLASDLLMYLRGLRERSIL